MVRQLRVGGLQVAQLTLWYARAAERTTLVPGAALRLELYENGRPYRRDD